MGRMYDLVLKGGRIYDGSGLPAFNADVGISQGRIKAIGRIHEPANRTLDVDGLAVSPGFIDLHTHLDAQFFWDPLASSLNEHGVTTVVTGNCGLTLAPCKPEDRQAIVDTFVRVEGMPANVLEGQIPWTWTSHAEYLDTLRRMPLGVNVATLIGHCAIRQFVLGDESVERGASEDEIEAMEDLVRDGMAAGAFGFSTNMNDRHFRVDGKPIPSRLASREEVDRLCGIVGECQRGVVQFSHGGFHSIENMGWYNDVAKATGRPLIWQSILHRWAQPDMWRKQLEQAAESFRQGAPAYPLTNARPFSNRWTLKNAQVFDELPTWKNLLFLPDEVRRQAFQDPDTRRKMTWEAVEDTKPISFSRRWDLVMIRKTVRPENRQWENHSVAEYAAAQGKPVIDAFLDLALSEDLETLFESSENQGDHDAVDKIVSNPYVLVGQSDAGAHLAFDAGFGYATMLLGHWSRERKALPLEEAVRKLTFMVASIFGIHDRGLLRPGYVADIAVFDPETVMAEDRELVYDLPGGEPRYVQHARGMQYTLVNGEVLMECGKHTGAYPGQVLSSN
jgi:N-acyl-D-amino-acid deacylase